MPIFIFFCYFLEKNTNRLPQTQKKTEFSVRKENLGKKPAEKSHQPIAFFCNLCYNNSV